MDVATGEPSCSAMAAARTRVGLVEKVEMVLRRVVPPGTGCGYGPDDRGRQDVRVLDEEQHIALQFLPKEPAASSREDAHARADRQGSQ